MVLKVEGFYIDSMFKVRELGYYTWQGEFGRIAFEVKTAWKQLSFDDKRSVSHLTTRVHGLTYEPQTKEKACKYYMVCEVIKGLYEKYKTDERTVVAFKGAHVERNLLEQMSIPNVDLEIYGCPNYQEAADAVVELLPGCGFHHNDLHSHCAMSKCHAFWLWMITHVV